MRTIPVTVDGEGQVICLPDDMSYEGVSELEIHKEGDVITLLPVRPSWSSLAELPKADADFMQEARPTIVPDQGR